MAEDFTRVDIYGVRRDGAGLRRVTGNPGGHYLVSATWSPDGRWILYHRQAGRTITVRKMRPHGGDDHKVVPGDDFNLEPSWRPLPA